MVNIVNNSFNDDAYRETNLQLARELNELRQQLGRKETEILELRQQMYELKSSLGLISSKYNRIVNIVLENGIDHPSHRSAVLPLPQPTEIDKSNVACTDLVAVSNHHSELDIDSGSESESYDSTLSAESTDARLKLARISEHSEEEQSSSNQVYSDSLEPPEITSMPPLTLHPEKPPQTPSIFNCLDTLRHNDSAEVAPEQNKSSAKSICAVDVSSTLKVTNFNSASPIHPVINNLKNNDMFQSTPVQKRDILFRENQENVRNNVSGNAAPQPKPKGQKRQPACKDTSNSTTTPGRYNLRKRTRV